MAVRGTYGGMDVIVRLDGTRQHLIVTKVEGGDLLERSGGNSGQPVLDGNSLRVGSAQIQLADDQLPAARDLLRLMLPSPRANSTTRVQSMRASARRIQIAGTVLLVIALLSGVVALLTGASEETTAVEAILSAAVTWAVGVSIAVTVMSLGDYLARMTDSD